MCPGHRVCGPGGGLPERNPVEVGLNYVRHILLVALLLSGWSAYGQGLNDLLSGKLLNPKVGQWAVYDLSDTSGKDKFVVRQAIVGEEKVGGKTAHWLELEIVPAVGFRTVYKMLVTGPASDPKNIHKIIVRQDPDPAETLPVDEVFADAPPPREPSRESLGPESVKTGQGPLESEHFRVAADSGPVDLWFNEKVLPAGIVRMKSADGEMILRAYGTGGDEAKSAVDEKGEAKPLKVTVQTEKRSAEKAEEAPKNGAKEGSKP